MHSHVKYPSPPLEATFNLFNLVDLGHLVNMCIPSVMEVSKNGALNVRLAKTVHQSDFQSISLDSCGSEDAISGRNTMLSVSLLSFYPVNRS